MEIILDFPDVPNLITWVLKVRELSLAVVRERCDYGGMVRETDARC